VNHNFEVVVVVVAVYDAQWMMMIHRGGQVKVGLSLAMMGILQTTTLHQ